MVEFSIGQILWNLLLAARWTIALSAIAFVGGGVVGLALLTARLRRWPGVATAVSAYVHVFQGTPLLIQLFLAYFGLGLFGIDVSPWVAAGGALTLYASAYLTEIWRGCVDAIPLRHVVAPQALRIAVAPTVGFLVQVIKGTALASIIGFIELTKTGTMIANATFRPFTVYACVALMYFALCWPVSAYSRRLERRMRRDR
jgi:polar amino acid transport system permease protein